jgi:hypothetical protein
MIVTRLHRAIAALILLCFSIQPVAFAQGTKISAMPSATTLGGTELVPIVQGGANKAATTAQIKTYSQTGLAAVATSGSATDLTTGTIPAARLPLFGSAANGAVSASGGGTTNFLRADGTWAAPAGGGGGGSSVTTQTGTTYTGVLADANSWIRFNNAAAITFTIPTNASVAYPVGTVIEFSQAGAGAVTVAAAGGVTLNSRGGAVTTAGIYAVASIKEVAADTWILSGDIM